MNKAILGKKIGMTQIFDETGNAIPVTVIEAGPCVVIQKKTIENDGYSAIQVGFVNIEEKKLNKPLKGHFEKHGIKPKRYIKELRLKDSDKYEVGQEIRVDIFTPGEKVDVVGTSKGKGFQGVIKRYGAKRGPMSHGSMYHRRVGSMGPNTNPGRTFPGKKMPGRTGGERVTIQNLKVVKVDSDRNLILLKGNVPGVKGSLVLIKDSVKSK
ncbi:50S ribosomal protein L3 [Caldicellulosiruptoraceae bacterium PP1]